MGCGTLNTGACHGDKRKRKTFVHAWVDFDNVSSMSMHSSILTRSTAMQTECLLHEPTGFGTFSASEWELSPEHSLMLPVQPGDVLQATQGTVWITIDGDVRDILLARGELHTATENAQLRLSGFDEPRVKVLSHRPVQARAWRDAQGWRHWLPLAQAWAHRRLAPLAL